MTFFKKSLLTLGLAALGFCAALVTTILVFMNSLYYEVNTAGLRNTAKTFLNIIGEDYLINIFLANEPVSIPIAAFDDYRLTLIAPSGYVLWDSHVTDRLVNHIDREEIIAALEGKEAGARRHSISTRMDHLYYALPVFEHNNIIGVFRLSISVPGFAERISSIIFPFTIFFVIMAIAVFWAIFAFSRSLSASLGRLVNITQAGSSLLSGPQAEEKVAPEFRSLEKAIRAMTGELTFRLQQAKAEGRRLEAILNGMSEALFAMDGDLKLHLVNPRARKLFNLEDADVIGKSLLEATYSTELEDVAKKTLCLDTSLETELTFYTSADMWENSAPQEREQQFQVYAAPLTDSETKRGVVIVMQDITRLVKLERVRKDFVANVSHELRTPIQLIKGFSETLHDVVSSISTENKKQIIHFVEIIQKNAGLMENLTNDLLILASLENNENITAHRSNRRLENDMEEVNIAQLLKEAVSSVEPQAKRKEIKINIECSNDLKALLYGSFIIQALINMIDNAIKYSPAKSKIRISAYCAAKDGGSPEELILQVKDKGIGIPAEHLERVFERFYRVDRARSREAGGTGLGLSIVRHIAMLHNGKAEAESRAGEGSVFRIRIPINR